MQGQQRTEVAPPGLADDHSRSDSTVDIDGTLLDSMPSLFDHSQTFGQVDIDIAPVGNNSSGSWELRTQDALAVSAHPGNIFNSFDYSSIGMAVQGDGFVHQWTTIPQGDNDFLQTTMAQGSNLASLPSGQFFQQQSTPVINTNQLLQEQNQLLQQMQAIQQSLQLKMQAMQQQHHIEMQAMGQEHHMQMQAMGQEHQLQMRAMGQTLMQLQHSQPQSIHLGPQNILAPSPALTPSMSTNELSEVRDKNKCKSYP